ncbi:hypothetical protein H9Q69_014051 [Fusarium xylarioides]|nr:hypothetical protein H9Q69_014051 [Fusarium xylarioides]
MASFVESYFLPVLIFFLEILVYLENLWYEANWSRWQASSTTTMDKLILCKEDEIWHAVIYDNNGDLRNILKDLTNNPEKVSDNGGVTVSPSNPSAVATSGKIEAGVLFRRPKTKLQKAVETDVEEQISYGSRRYDMAVKARLEAIADLLANSSQKLTKNQQQRAQEWSSGKVSILWMAIHQDHKSDMEYLLTERNQKLEMGNTFQQKTVLHKAVSESDGDLVRNILENNSLTSPETYINAGDFVNRTPLHDVVVYAFRRLSIPTSIELDNTLKVFGLLSEHGANINALDDLFMTPLHLLFSEALYWKNRLEGNREHSFLIPLLDSFLLAGAEVQTKDMEGM